MTNQVVASLSGKAKDIYNRDFGFFRNLTPISGKPKLYIKKEKSAKKANGGYTQLITQLTG